MNDLNFPSSRRFEMTEIEGKYLSRKLPTEKDGWVEWLADIIIGSVFAAVLVSLFIVLFILWRADRAEAAEPIKDDAAYCQELSEGKWNVAPEDREEVSAYCANI